MDVVDCVGIVWELCGNYVGLLGNAASISSLLFYMSAHAQPVDLEPCFRRLDATENYMLICGLDSCLRLIEATWPDESRIWSRIKPPLHKVSILL